MLYRTVTWNDMKFRKSKFVLDATSASHSKDQARHFELVDAIPKALPRRSRGRHSNDSTVDSSCTSLEFTSWH